MMAGRFIGRVGELAVVLGVGVGLSLGAPTAWADDTSASSSSSNSTSSESTSSNDSSSDDSSSFGTRSAPEDASSDDGSDSSESDGGARGRSSREERVARAQAESNSPPTEADDDEDSEETVSVAVAAPIESASAPDERSGGDSGGSAAAPIAWVVAAAARRELGDPTAVAATAENQVPVITAVEMGSPSSTSGWVRGKISAADPDNDRLRYAAKSTAKGILFMSSSSGKFTYIPRRAARHAASAVTATEAAKQDSISVTVSDRYGGVVYQTVTVPIAAKNRVPLIFVRVGRPSASTGVATGKVGGFDFDFDPLQYSSATTTSKGSIILDASTRTFIYTPTDTARHAAAAIGAPASTRTDTFAITVSDGHGGTVTKNITVAVTPKNAAPTAAAVPSVGAPNVDTGIVTGTMDAIDTDGDPLSYKASPKKGAIVFGTGGAFTYTPTDAARAAAATTSAPATAKRDTFTVTIADAYGGATTRSLTVAIAPAAVPGVTVIGDVTVPGTPSRPPVSNADSTRTVITTAVSSPLTGVTTRVVILDTTNGSQVGSTLTITDALLGTPDFNADGTRVLITTGVSDTTGTTVRFTTIDTTTGVRSTSSATLIGNISSSVLTADGSRALVTIHDPGPTSTTRMALVDTATGAQLGSMAVAGIATEAPQLAANGTRALITTLDGNTTHIASMDLISGHQVGTTLAFAGSGGVQFSDDLVHALLITTGYDLTASADFTVVATIDTITGTQIGVTTTLVGNSSGSLPLSADASRALITVLDGDETSGFTTHVAVIDTITGSMTTTTVIGGQYPSPVLSVDGKRVLITTYVRGQSGTTTRVTAIDTTTGAHISTTTLTGDPYASALVNADGSRALVVTAVYNGQNSTFNTGIAVIDTATGTQIGNTISVPGYLSSGPPLVSLDGNRAVVAATDSSHTTRALVVDTTTGAQLGVPLSLTGYGYLVSSGDGNFAVVTGGSQVKVLSTTLATEVGPTLTFTGTMRTPLVNTDGSRAVINTTDYKPGIGYTTRVAVLRIA